MNGHSSLKVMPLLAAVLLFASSCTNEKYALTEENIDGQMQFFSEGLTLPLGNIEKLQLKDFFSQIKGLDSEDLLVTMEDGSYAFSFGDSYDFSETLNDKFSDFTIDAFSSQDEVGIRLTSANAADISAAAGYVPQSAFGYSSPFQQQIIYEIDLGGILPDGLKEVGKITLKDVYLDFNLDVSCFSGLRETEICMEFDLGLPEMFISDDPRVKDGVISISATIKGGETKADIDPVKICAFDFTGYDLHESFDNIFVIDGKLTVRTSLTESLEWLKNNRIQTLKATTMLATRSDSEQKTVEVESIEAKIDYDFEPVKQRYDFSALSDLSGENSEIDITLDLNRFYFTLDIESSTTLPLDVNLHITPYYDGHAAVDKELTAALSLVSDGKSSTKFWLSNKDEGRPDGYDFVELDLLSLFRDDIPQYLDLSFSGRASSDEFTVVNLSEELILAADYQLNIPLEPGEDFRVEYKKVMPDLSDLVGQVLSMGSVGITGEFENSLPLRMDVKLNLIDSRGQTVASASQVLQSRSSDGTASKSELEMILRKVAGAATDDVSALEVILIVDSGSAAGQALNEKDYVAGTLKLVIPEGVTIER